MTSERSSHGPGDEPQAPPEGPGASRQTVDVQKLAEKVYRLLLADLRLERARGTPPTRRRGRP